MANFQLEINPGDIIEFTYTNYKGKVGQRKAQVLRFYYAANEYHPEPQFILAAIDLDKGEPRGFAVKDISNLNVLETRVFNAELMERNDTDARS
jgi:hypothetical protein